MDAGYAKIMEIPAEAPPIAIKKIVAMIEDGSLRCFQDGRHQKGRRLLDDVYDEIAFKTRRDEELRPRQGSDELLRPAIPMQRTTHRLLRAVAIRRAKNIPGEQPSIGTIVEELVEKSRPELEKEAGALYKRELAKKR